jgi:hypothetical protein
MGIAEDYLRYLDHFGATTTVHELWQASEGASQIALRHDLDHDLDLALEMAFWEHDRGFRASYYLLHTAPYWDDPRLAEKVLQLQDFGHEVGLHVNVLTEWFTGKIDYVTARMVEVIDELRGAGVEVNGISTHGDSACYTYGFANHWCFTELRPADPITSESGCSAEGVPVDDPRFQLAYPADDRLRREDGTEMPLWTTSMADLGLHYNAVHVPHDRYFTDSGGTWKRSHDPLCASLGRGRHQILIHPVYWRAQRQRLYFFLSTARAGSRWLTHLLQEATPLMAKHEFSLNHRYSNGEWVPEKRTAKGFAHLVEKPEECRELLAEARAYIEDLEQDYAEANVYLVHLLSQLLELFPDATLVHLHREPREVVRSLLNRDWYDTPEDDSHPRLNVHDWDQLSQLEKACWYVRKANEDLLELDLPKLAFQQMTTDITYLREVLRRLGIPFYPRLATRFEQPINTTSSAHVAAYECWSPSDRAIFDRICDPTRRELGYLGPRDKGFLRALIRKPFTRSRYPSPRPHSSHDFEASTLFDTGTVPVSSYTAHACVLSPLDTGLQISGSSDRHAHLLLGAGQWHRADPNAGWTADFNAYFRGFVQLGSHSAGRASLFCLMYDRQGVLLARRSLATLHPADTTPFSFATRPHALRFNLALYLPRAEVPPTVTLRRAFLERLDPNPNTHPARKRSRSHTSALPP